MKNDSHFLFGEIALAGFLVEYFTCTEIRAVESSTGPFVTRGWQPQSKTGNLNKTCNSDVLLPLVEDLTT
jgi:hypothetical protein